MVLEDDLMVHSYLKAIAYRLGEPMVVTRHLDAPIPNEHQAGHVRNSFCRLPCEPRTGASRVKADAEAEV